MADTNERELAEQRYVGLAHDYESNPIGSRDWVIFWNGWRERSELKATPLPADAALIGKLRHQLAQATDEAARLRALSQPGVAQVPDAPLSSVPLSALVCVGRARFPRTGGNAGISWHVEDALSDTGGFRSGSPCNGELLFVLPTTAKRAMLSAAPSAKGGE